MFPSRQDRPLRNETLRVLLRKADIQATTHGWRSTFRDWCGEAGVAREVAEACLAHRVGNAAELAYSRSDLLERRRPVMQAWAEYITH